MMGLAEYDPRFLAGIACFNGREFFAAHEFWEELWLETAGPERRFVQGLIQAAVSVYHAGNGNYAGARRLFHSGRRYMSAWPSSHMGMNVPAFWSALEAAMTDFLTEVPATSCRLRAELVPAIELDPPPPAWPSPGPESS